VGPTIRDAAAASRQPLTGKYAVTSETVATPGDRYEPSEGDHERLSDEIDVSLHMLDPTAEQVDAAARVLAEVFPHVDEAGQRRNRDLVTRILVAALNC